MKMMMIEKSSQLEGQFVSLVYLIDLYPPPLVYFIIRMEISKTLDISNFFSFLLTSISVHTYLLIYLLTYLITQPWFYSIIYYNVILQNTWFQIAKNSLCICFMFYISFIYSFIYIYYFRLLSFYSIISFYFFLERKFLFISITNYARNYEQNSTTNNLSKNDVLSLIFNHNNSKSKYIERMKHLFCSMK